MNCGKKCKSRNSLKYCFIVKIHNLKRYISISRRIILTSALLFMMFQEGEKRGRKRNSGKRTNVLDVMSAEAELITKVLKLLIYAIML